MDKLRCFTCGKTKDIPPVSIQFGVDLLAACANAQWIGVFAMAGRLGENGRILVFCTNKCAVQAINSKGAYRKRSPKLYNYSVVVTYNDGTTSTLNVTSTNKKTAIYQAWEYLDRVRDSVHLINAVRGEGV